MPQAAIAAIVVGAAATAVAKGSGAGSDIDEQRAQAILKEYEKKAIEAGEEGFAFQEAELRPYIDVGLESLSTLSGEIDELTRPFTEADFEEDPGFRFRLEEGEKKLRNELNRIGLSESGAALKAGVDYVGNEASNEFQNAFNRFQVTQGNRFNRLLSLVDTGQRASENLVAAKGTETANKINTLRGTGAAVAGRQSVIGDIRNEARRTRANALAGFFKTSSEAASAGLGGGPTGGTL